MRLSRPDIPFIRRTLVLARAEVLHVLRDRATLAQIVVVPTATVFVVSSVRLAAATGCAVCFATIPATTAPAAARMPRRFNALPVPSFVFACIVPPDPSSIAADIEHRRWGAA